MQQSQRFQNYHFTCARSSEWMRGMSKAEVMSFQLIS